MSTTLTIDTNGGAFIPAALLEAFGLRPGEQVIVELSPTHKKAPRTAQIADRDGFLVITGTEPFNAAEAVQTAREERQEELLTYRDS